MKLVDPNLGPNLGPTLGPDAAAQWPPPSPFRHAPLLPTALLLGFWAACVVAQAAYFRHLKPLGQMICILAQLVPIMLGGLGRRVASALVLFFVLLTVGVGVSTEVAYEISPRPPFVDHYRPHTGPLIAGVLCGLVLAATLTLIYVRSRLRQADRDAQTMLVSGLFLAAAAVALACTPI